MDYSLQDLIMFSPDVYWRMLSSITKEFSWLSGLASAASLWALVLFKQSFARQLVYWVAGACWVWLSWHFYIIEYDSINWVARYIGGLGLFLTPVFIALAIRTNSQLNVLELAVFSSTIVYVVLLRPVIMLTLGHNLEFSGIGLVPVPTLIVCIGILLSTRFYFRWLVVSLLSGLFLIEVITLFLLQDSMWQEGPVVLAALLMIAYSGKYRQIGEMKKA